MHTEEVQSTVCSYLSTPVPELLPTSCHNRNFTSCINTLNVCLLYDESPLPPTPTHRTFRISQ
jgi:hypothetical protein